MNINIKEKKLLFIILFSLIAIFNAVYLTYMAYNIGIDSAGSVCDINQTFSCSGVFENGFSRIFGIPFSLLALLVYPIIVIVALLGYLNKIKNYYKIILIISILGLLFNSYIIVNEYLISTYCILCLICTFIILINGILSFIGIHDKNI